MKKSIITLLVCFVVLSCLFGQHTIERQVIASAGGFGETSSYLVSATVGEVATASFISGDFVLTQGFQQAGDQYTAVNDIYKTVAYNFYPNPTSGDATLELNMPLSAALNFEVFDVSGKSLWKINKDVSEGIFRQKINLNNIPAGSYFIKICDPDSELLQTIPFKKIR